MKIAVLGAGAWGTAVAISIAARHSVALWSRRAEHRAQMRESRTNAQYLPGYGFPPALAVGDSVADALGGAELALIATPTAGFHEVVTETLTRAPELPVVWLCKGFEPRFARLPHQVFDAEAPNGTRCGVLSGPSFAEEVAAGLPTAVTLASRDAAFARDVARALHSPAFRVYSSDDLVGVEVAGAVKNVMAIAAGICDGLKLGHNARAALITRGLAEISRLGVAMGGRAETFMGLAGAGDLILTCTGDLSRNRRVGLQLGRGVALERILAELGHVAEGVNSARVLQRLAAQLRVEMPVTQAVCRVLDDYNEARAAADALLQREPRAEH